MNGALKAKTPTQYINSLTEPRRSQIKALDQLIRKTAPTLKPFIGYGALGYGKYHYQSISGREGDWYAIGLASQKNYISLYFCVTDGDQYLAEKFKSKLPKASIGKSCVRFKRLEDVNIKTIEAMIHKAVKLLPKQKNITTIT